MNLFYRFCFFGLITSIMCGCVSTFPTKQISMDLSNETIPIMMTKVTSDNKVKTFHFQSGFSSLHQTSRYSSGNVQVSTSFTENHNENAPFSSQVSNLFVQNPKCVYLSKFNLENKRSIVMLLNISDKINYTSKLELTVPVIGESK